MYVQVANNIVGCIHASNTPSNCDKKKCREWEEIEYFLICYLYMGRLSNASHNHKLNGLANSQMEKKFEIEKKIILLLLL